MEEWNDGRVEGLTGIRKSALKNTLLVNARKQCKGKWRREKRRKEGIGYEV